MVCDISFYIGMRATAVRGGLSSLFDQDQWKQSDERHIARTLFAQSLTSSE